jgi:hypothetical protein
MSDKIKRKLKSKFTNSGLISYQKIPYIILVIGVVFFLGTQLYINSMLSPLGGKLQSLNSEKDLLLQENRELEKDLANAQSITVVQNLTNKKYKLTPSKATQFVYVTNNVNALR